ncbi:4423_t:CDS:2 [Funneliformis caledonium]|uniref:4423_t:CDS:1 n=1 Tax=Funneliformis caledonium TaxID=1117310 RepID=A0A9N8V799_9GLOM|nr:4423_t:CDS:2 [Funneliformis caledonium]
MNLFKWLSKTSTAKHNNLENDSSKVIDNIPKVENKTLDLWKEYNYEYQRYVTIASVKLVEIKRMNKRAVVSTEDLEKRKKAYGTCGECYKPGTGNRPTAKELCQTLERLSEELWNPNSEINPQIEECKRIRANKFKSECKPKSLQTHSQAIYTSRLINFKNLPEPVNSSPCQIFTVSECLDAQISEAMSV